MKDEDKTKEQLIDELAELRQREQNLEAERQRLFAILEGLPAQVYLIGPDHLFRYSNNFFQERFGNPEAKPCYKVFHGLNEPCEQCTTFKLGENMKCEQGEYTYQDGYTYRNNDIAFIDIDGTEVLLSFGLDITERKQVETALHQSEEKFSKAFHGNPDLMAISTLIEGRYIEVNDAFVEITGYERHETIGRTAQELGIWALPEERDYLLKEIQKIGNIRGFELDLRLRSGEIRRFCLSGEIIDIDGVPHLLNASRDITESKRMEKALSLSEECFSKAFNTSPIVMTITSLEDGRFIKVNNAFCRIWGYSHDEIVEHSSLGLGFWLNPADRYLVKQRIMAKQSIQDMEIGFCKKSGEQRLGLYSAEGLEIDGEPCILSVLTDITELRQMEVEMTRLDRLNLVGEMAASIGHEIRNPMTTVRGYLQILRENKDYVQEIDYFDLMIEELDRANSIITEFLSLAKNKMVDMKTTSLNAIISKLLPLIQAKAMSKDQYIKVELDELPYLLLDKKEIRQLILNLVDNGMESMSSPGVVTIRTFMQKKKVVLAVQDQGHGIDCELLDKLGTPFFTTKEQGTGLGLAVCYRIASRHNAKINIETSSTGTTFYVRFPSLIVVTTVS
ncbi:MAG: PAS domain S-box protein [Syntrophomonas sp.]|nr:PAS domain S-box protein [Syntrophomonas sp.]